MKTESLQFKIFTVISYNCNIEYIDVWGKKKKTFYTKFDFIK